jgi:hypothetical protein
MKLEELEELLNSLETDEEDLDQGLDQDLEDMNLNMNLSLTPPSSPECNPVRKVASRRRKPRVVQAAGDQIMVIDKRRVHRCTYPGCNKVYTKSSHLKVDVVHFSKNNFSNNIPFFQKFQNFTNFFF